MRFRTKLFVTSSVVILLMCVGAMWPIQRTISTSFNRLADENFASMRSGLHQLQGEHINHMRQVGTMLMDIPELRALIAEHNFEISADNLASLQERLDGLTSVMGANFICVLDGRGFLVAQNSSSPWPNLGELRGFIKGSEQARPLVRRLFDPSRASTSSSGEYGLWVYNGQLYQVVGMPLVFSVESDKPSPPDGALIMAEPMSNDLAAQLGTSHQCDISFLAAGQTLASSLSHSLEEQLVSRYSRGDWPSNQPFNVALDDADYRAYREPTIDPCSGTAIGDTIIVRSLAEVASLQRMITYGLLAILAAGLLAASFLSFVLSEAITEPIGKLVAGVRRVTDGDLNSSIQLDRRDELGELAAAFNDMVTQLRTRRQLERLVEESKAASKAKSQFLANMSHEIRTPLHGVIGMANLLLATDLDQRQRHYAELVKSSTEVLTTLINDILDFSKIEAGKLELEISQFNPPSIVEDVVELLSQKAFGKGVEIAADISIDVPAQVQGDATRLRQVLLNLIGNAIKFTEMGEIIVRVGSEHADEHQVTLWFAVSDTGIGIPPDRRNRLFKPFSQVDASTTRQFGGTGLGLAISKQLIELMGGNIGVQSQPGLGSTFRFTVTFDAVQHDVIESPVELKNRRVLVAETNPSVSQIICQQLTDAGMEAFSAESAYEAITQLAEAHRAQKPYAALVVDRRMHGAAAILASRRQEPGQFQLPAILLTAANDPLNEKQFATVEWFAALPRPIRRTQLITTISAALGIEHPAAPATPVTTGNEIERKIKAPRILVVEDNQVNQMVASELLTKAGYEVDMVSDGQTAVSAVLAGGFDLVLMDCQMPVMDGLEATQLIRRNEATLHAATGIARPAVPIVALTANASGTDRRKCLDAGMNGYCGKPYHPQELLDVIESLLKDRPAADEPTHSTNTADAASEPDVDSPPCDVKTFLENCTGNAGLAMKVLDKFEQQTQDVLAELEKCLGENNGEELARVSHATKGTAGTLAAESLRKTLAQLEQIGRANAMDIGQASLEKLREEIQRFTSYLPKVRSELRDISGT